MANIEIESGELSQVIDYAKEAEEKVKTALDKVKKLEVGSSSQDQTWTGESKNSYLMYLGILQEYHSDLADCVKIYSKAVTSLKKDISSYDSSEMGEIRGI